MEEPILLDVLIHPWKNRHDDTERLVIRFDEKKRNGAGRAPAELEELLAPVPRPLPASGGESRIRPGELRGECTAVRDHLQALLASSQSIAEVLGPGEKGPRAELMLFEMQVKRILDMIGRMEEQLGRGAP